MASSIQSTRWTSTRKSGMTVLGKVPKPINLPSQKLENHGLDPNVEIVPKGTLTWGARPLLAASSAWGSSTLSSPRTDGSVGSPIHANGRPSSGGSGTRPSTGSSERSSEPVALSWGSSSRPSSASGILPSSHMSVAANRPRSAENRPNSSHLSRFAESSVDSIAWGAAGTSEKVTADASKKSNFTLSSGDFPTLGSEKNDEPKSQKGQNPNVSASPASALSSSLKGTSKPLLTSGHENPGLALHGNFNSWSADTHPYAGDDPSTRTENWHQDIHNAQPLLDAHMAAQQYGPWHGPAHHSPVVWHGGHEAGALYRPSFGPPGTYHVGPYYPYVQAGALPNNQAFPRAETISGGVHLKDGEAYRHMPPESYLPHGESGIPVRPGVYPGPVLYETHPSFDNSSEQVGSTAGMPGQYGLHNQNRSENQRLQPWRFHARPDGPLPVTIIQHEISGQANETQGQYKVLLKQHGSREEKYASWKEHAAVASSTAERGSRTGFSTPEPYSMDQSYKEEEKNEEEHGKVSHCQHPKDLVDQNDRNSLGTCKSAGHNVIKKLDTYQQNAIVKKNASLMEKVEGLNSKTRAVDVHFEGENPTKEMRSDQNSRSGEGFFAGVSPANPCSASSTSVSGARNLGTNQSNAPTKVMIHESVFESNYSEDGGHSRSHNQKVVLDVKGKGEHHEKLKFGSYGADDANNSLEKDSLEKTSVKTGKSGCLLSITGSQLSKAASDDQGSHLILNSVSDRSSLKTADHDVQHAKLKEMARQRALQLQKEEEERTAEQKAKALAKLAELNERAPPSSKQASRHAEPLHNDSPNNHSTSDKDEKATTVSEALHGSFSCDFEAKKHPNDANIVKLKDSSDLSFTQSSGTSDPSVQGQVSVGEQSWQLGPESNPEFSTGKSASFLPDNNVSRRKQAWNRRRRSNVDERNQSEKLNNSESGGNTRCASMANEDASDGLGILNSDPPPVQASKNNRGPKYKNKLSDTQLNSQLPHLTQPEGSSGKVDLNSDGTKTPAKLIEPLSVQENNSNESLTYQDSIHLKAGTNNSGSESAKLTTERATNNWKTQTHRKPTRNAQSDKANAKYIGNETVVWAPVKVVNKDGSSESHKSSAGELTNLSDGKNVQDTRNGAKAKRAEIERYVPKPIAKELSLQGDSHQSSSTVVPGSSSAGKAGKHELASSSAVTGKNVSSTVAKTALISMNTEDNKQSRQGKTHSSWRQRNPGEAPSHEHSEQSSGPSKSAEQTSEHQHSKPSDDFHVEGTNNNPQIEPMATSGIVKDHGATRLKRQQFKEVKVDGTSYAPHSKSLQGELPNKKEWQPAAPVDSGDRNSSRNENQNAGSGHMKAHWQPKSQFHSQQYQHGYKGGGGQRATEKLLPSQTVEQQFEYQSGHNKDGDMLQKNSGASEESSEAHRVSSGPRYGMQGHHHFRRGGHSYGPRRGGASVRMNGSYDMVG